MFLVAGINSRLEPIGVADNAVCKSCGKACSLHVTHKYMTPHVFFIPTFKFHSEYIVTCGGCASVMELNPEKGSAFKKDPTTLINPDDLTVVINNTTKTCVLCGARADKTQKFCGECGEKL